MSRLSTRSSSMVVSTNQPGYTAGEILPIVKSVPGAGHVTLWRLSSVDHVSLSPAHQFVSISLQHTSSTKTTMIFGKLGLAFLLVTVAAFFCAQSVEATKGPRITHKVYFDIKHGDKEMGRSTF